MRKIFSLSVMPLVLALSAAHAAPVAEGDDMGRFLSERGFVERLGAVGESLEQRATELVVSAMGFLGVPYRRGGNDAETGFDCSGFVRAMYQQTAGLLLPRKAEQQAAATEKIDRTELRPGDLVFFNTMRRAFSHVGIYVGNGKFIHSPNLAPRFGWKTWASPTGPSVLTARAE